MLTGALAATFIVVALISGMAVKHGLRTVALALTSGAAASIILSVLTLEITSENWLYLAVVVILGALIGPLIRYKGIKNPGLSELLKRVGGQFLTLGEDFRVRVLAVALAVAIILTYEFGHLAVNGPSSSFWFGFYQAWTAGLVAFVILGIGSTMVSLYRGEKDHFRNRVRILFGQRDENTINYLTNAVQKLGYYSVLMDRKYIIEKYYPDKGAYMVKVEHTSRTRNFLHDVSVPDKVTFYFKPDVFDPPIPLIGHLLTLNIDGVSKLAGPIPIGPEGKSEEHDIHIPMGGEATVFYEFRCLFKTGASVKFRPARYSQGLQACVWNQLETGESILISNDKDAVNTVSVSYGQSHSLGPVLDQIPNSIAWEFFLLPPN